jgi:hypothetical protein
MFFISISSNILGKGKITETGLEMEENCQKDKTIGGLVRHCQDFDYNFASFSRQQGYFFE